MRYLGGKARICKDLSKYINNRLSENQPYWEPMVGAGWVLQYIDPYRKRYASDICPELIALWKALQKGWMPPDYITKDKYYYIKNNTVEEELKGFVGFGCSYSGKWWGGYANDNSGRNYAGNAKNSLMNKIQHLKDVNFFCCDYTKPKPKGFLIYCDPPYAGTTEYKNKFESESFWGWVRQNSIYNTILVSEYKAPEDFKVVWEKETKTDMRVSNVKEKRIEKVFEYTEV